VFLNRCFPVKLQSVIVKPSVKTWKRGILCLCKLAWYQTDLIRKKIKFLLNTHLSIMFYLIFILHTYNVCTLFYLCQLQGGGRWWSTLFYLCWLQGEDRWWGFYLHIKYTLQCQLQGGDIWLGFYLHMEYTLLSMSAPGWG